MPRQAIATAPDRIQISEYELRPLGEGEVRVRAEFAAAKHGTELAMIKRYSFGRGRYDHEWGLFLRDSAAKAPAAPPTSLPGPIAIGNMFVGTVIELGQSVRDFREGDRVLGYGSFREINTAAADRVWKMPPDLDWRSAVCLDPADFAMAAVRDGHVRIGDAVAVFGMGAIGLMAVQFAKLSGACPVIAVDPLPNRRQAAQACGADLALDPLACDPALEIRRATAKRGVDVAIDYSGHVQALQTALRAVAFGGNVVAGSFPPPYPAGLDFGAEAHLNISNIIFSRACSDPNREHPRWDEKRIYAHCWRLICEGTLTGIPVVQPLVAFDTLPAEYLKIATRPQDNIKLGVRYGTHENGHEA